METQTIHYKIRKELRVSIKQKLPNLIKYKQEDNEAAFYDLLLEILPDLRQYVNKRVLAAIQKGHFPRNKYDPNDFIDELFIETYDHIENFSNADEFYMWLYKKANELLEDVIIEEEFDELFFKNIDDYSKPEWDAMQENYSTDGGGDILMIDELDDISYYHNDYTLNHVFVENKEKALIEKIDKDLNTKEIQNHIAMVLHNLPLAMRTVFELHTNQHLDLKEIAHIRNTSLKEVEQLLKDAKKALQVSFFNRYSVN
ncbi:sigma-70 family RNA polymerase sigma factor [Polaribacter sp. ALD11]|uniref:RNA polymerase sigma factor n=1 Tax=Polaribacter sp. ALD11 TaxID=2058137 RepID=UPI000C30B665|nr:sigma-70 family RNA polymerase sigma factor [Polaribacter sp. ALD11]AUC84641.1 sigma-70 family RNA polymerase sigma factor [Polaribacter sp. ALD11]